MKKLNITTFDAFQSRNYRLYFSGQSVSLMGTWMQRTAVYWIVYMQTHSVFMLGVAAFCIQFPSFLFSLIGGSVADRYNKYKVLLITQVTSMLQAIALTLLVFFTKYTVFEILALSTLLGFINAFDVPARQSLVHYMVNNKEHLGNAIALNSSMANLARLIGPAVSGFVLEKLGAGVCFLMNSLSFLAVIGSLLMMRLPDNIPQNKSKKVMEGLKEGLSYLKATPSIGYVVILMALSGLLVLPYVTLLPVIAKETLGGSASTYGYLNSFIGIGAITGAILLASLKSQVNLRKILFVALLIFGTGLIFFSRSHHLATAFLFASVSGFGMMLNVTLVNTILQTTSSVEMRGRVISYYAMAFFGMQPLGALLIGSVSHYIGTASAIFSQGTIAILIGIVFFKFLWKNKAVQPG